MDILNSLKEIALKETVEVKAATFIEATVAVTYIFYLQKISLIYQLEALIVALRSAYMLESFFDLSWHSLLLQFKVDHQIKLILLPI